MHGEPNRMKKRCVLIGLSLVLSFSALALDTYPMRPDPRLTVGSLCTKPSQRRYPEKIGYCNRSVDSGLKDAIFQNYIDLGYKMQPNSRRNYKMDHLIPLCAGGSNEADNLWPQHPQIYEITDPLEPLICDKMEMGVLKQREAVDLVLRAKDDLSEVRAIMEYVDRL